MKLAGKKTYIAAAVLAALGICGYLYGAIPAATALAILASAFGMFGLRDHQERYAQATLDEIGQVKKIVADLKAGDKGAITADVEGAAGIAIGVASAK